MRALMRYVGWLLLALLVFGTALFAWLRGLAQDDGGAGRPTYGAYTWPAPRRRARRLRSVGPPCRFRAAEAARNGR